MEPIIKHCWKCKQDKNIEEYCRNGADSTCKTCRYALNSEWAKNNRAKLRPKRAQYMKLYRAKKEEEARIKQAAESLADPAKDPQKA